MDIRETFYSFSRFSEDDLPHISNLLNRVHPKLKRNLFEESDCDELVQVYLRVKPTSIHNSLYRICNNHSFVSSVDTTTAGHGRRTQANVSKLYTFSHIFGPNSCQKDIFDHIVRDNLRKLTDGQSYTLLTYGVSGSGKTFTLMGTEAQPGLVPRSLEYLFKIVEAGQNPVYKPSDGQADRLSHDEQHQELQWVSKLRNVPVPVREKYKRMSINLSNTFGTSTNDLSANRTQYYIWVSFVEIYNENIFDLLVPGDRRTKLVLREDTGGNVYVKGLRHAFVRSGAEAYDVMVAGRHNLQVAATGVHATSSRSHCIFTITLLTDTPNGIKTACVKLCDLAGSERANNTRNTGTRMAESRAINSSLHVLERCLHALRKRKPNNLVPYRESKLTRLLGSGLSGARGEPVTMLVTVNTSPQFVNETRHVLQLASVAKDIQINNTYFEQSSTTSSNDDLSSFSTSEVLKLRAENERQQFEIAQLIKTTQQLEASIEEDRLSHAQSMNELVQEVKDMEKQYYEAQIKSMEDHHKAEMEDVLDELQIAKQLACNKEQLLKVVSKIEECVNKNNPTEIPQLTKQLRLYIGDIEVEDDTNETADETVRRHESSDLGYIRKKLSVRESCYIDDRLSYEYSESKKLRDSSVCPRDTTYSAYNNTSNDSVLNDKSYNIEQEPKSANNSSSINSGSNDKKRGTYFVSNAFDNNDEVPSESKCNKNRADSIVSIRESLDSTKDRLDFVDLNNDTDSPQLQTIGLLSEEKPAIIQQYAKTQYIMNESNVSSLDLNSDSDLDNIEPLGLKEKIKQTNYDLTKSFTRGSSIDGSLMLFEKFEDAVNKEVEAQAEVVVVEKGPFFTYKKKASFFRNSIRNAETINEEIEKVVEVDCDIKEHPTENPSDDEIVMETENRASIKTVDTSLISECQTVIKKKLTQKVMSMDIFESPLVMENVIEKKINDDDTKNEIDKKIYSNGAEIDNDDDDKLEIETISKIHEEAKVNNEIELEKSIKKLSLIHSHKKNNTEDYFSYDQGGKSDESLPSKEISESAEKIFASNEKELDDTHLLESQLANVTKSFENNTLDAFDKLFDSATSSRATEFDLLARESIATNVLEIKQVEPETKNNFEVDNGKKKKYNFRCRNNLESKNDEDKSRNEIEKAKPAPKRVLKLRRCKNIDLSDNDIEAWKTQFCDMISDMPAPPRVVREPSPSPEGDQENVLPLELQSCPVRSIARSRRKLFTPRAEPVEQSPDSGGRPRVLRPSYTRGRARRRLQ